VRWRLSGSGSSFLSPTLFYRALGGLEEWRRGVVYIAKIYNPTAKAKRRAGLSEAGR
jgi:hypothetical protein